VKAEAKEEAVEKVEVRDHTLPEAEVLKSKPPLNDHTNEIKD
jgi:hypothetical protein